LAPQFDKARLGLPVEPVSGVNQSTLAGQAIPNH
jgi:hypothetical protein